MLPRWGTLFTYGRALVINMFRLPFSGNIFFVVSMIEEARVNNRRGCAFEGRRPCVTALTQPRGKIGYCHYAINTVDTR